MDGTISYHKAGQKVASSPGYWRRIDQATFTSSNYFLCCQKIFAPLISEHCHMTINKTLAACSEHHRHTHSTTVTPFINPLPTKANCFRKQESMYKVLTPNIKPPYKFLWAYGHFSGSYGLYRVHRVLNIPLCQCCVRVARLLIQFELTEVARPLQTAWTGLAGC